MSDQALYQDRRRHDRRTGDRDIPERMAVVETTLARHVSDCVARGARLERIGVWVLGLVSTTLVAILASLITKHLG